MRFLFFGPGTGEVQASGTRFAIGLIITNSFFQCSIFLSLLETAFTLFENIIFWGWRAIVGLPFFMRLTGSKKGILANPTTFGLGIDGTCRSILSLRRRERLGRPRRCRLDELPLF